MILNAYRHARLEHLIIKEYAKTVPIIVILALQVNLAKFVRTIFSYKILSANLNVQMGLLVKMENVVAVFKIV